MMGRPPVDRVGGTKDLAGVTSLVSLKLQTVSSSAWARRRSRWHG